MKALWNRTGFRGRLLLTNFLLATVLIVAIGVQYYSASKSMAANIVRNNLHDTVVKNNEILKSKLERIKEYALGFVVDPDLQALFQDIYDADNEYEMFLLDKKINRILNKYFLHSPDIYSVYLITEPYVFGGMSGNGYFPKDGFQQTDLYRQAVRANGKLTWSGVYSFVEMFRQEQMAGVNFEYERLFSALKTIDHVQFKYFEGPNSPEIGVDDPVLMINFKESFFTEVFDHNIPIGRMFYFIVSPDGRYITRQNGATGDGRADFEWLDRIAGNRSGIDTVGIEGEPMIIAYDTLDTTDWISVFAVNENFIINDILPVIRDNVISIVAVMIIISIVLTILTSSMITRPIRMLYAAFSRVGVGDFDQQLPETGSREFRMLIGKFNGMNRKIQSLIEENYKSAIMQKEAEIKALNLQLDPHFMYNTLNIINLKLIRNGQDETSDIIMSLSAMLKYSLESKSDVSLFLKDLDYTKSYVHIMEKRFEGKFGVEYRIDPRLYEYEVPRFFLQPLVENVLIHGFKGLDRKGVLKISGRIEADERIFRVEDNGVGISTDKLMDLQNGAASIGIKNVRDRIRILYGEEYGLTVESAKGRGTNVTVRLPLQDGNDGKTKNSSVF